MLDPYIIVLAPNPSLMTGSGTNTIILGHGREGATLIDPAVDDPAYLSALIQAGEERGGIRRILITHGHEDHIGGAVTLREKLGVAIYAFSRAGVPMANEEVPNGTIFPAGDDTLRAIHTPGHRFDHLSFLLETQRILFAGDLLAGVGTVVIVPPEGNMLDYLGSLQHLQTLDLTAIVPAHGPVINDPQARLAEYIEHRMQREQQVLTILEVSPRGIDIPSIVQQIYTDVSPALHAMAARSIEAHLLKLEREGRARRAGDNFWSLA
ncbi:MAG: MBL fold metallo-hydrolase [Ktedonobacteraceae bacterium]